MFLLWNRNRESSKRDSLVVRSKYLAVCPFFQGWLYLLCDYPILSASVQCQPPVRLFVLIQRLFLFDLSFCPPTLLFNLLVWLPAVTLMFYRSCMSTFWFWVCLAISNSPHVLLFQVSSASLPPPPVCYACSSYVLVIVFKFFFFFPCFKNCSQELGLGPCQPWAWTAALSCHLFTLSNSSHSRCPVSVYFLQGWEKVHLTQRSHHVSIG